MDNLPIKRFHEETAGQFGTRDEQSGKAYFTDEYVHWLQKELRSLQKLDTSGVIGLFNHETIERIRQSKGDAEVRLMIRDKLNKENKQ